MAKSRTIFIGDRFGFLVIQKWSSEYKKWECLCDCGKTCYKPTSHLKSGNVISCGCWKNRYDNATHSPEYSSFRSMQQRAGVLVTDGTRTKAQYYDKGIRICPQWELSPYGFKRFLKDMGKRPDGCTLERKDLKGDYTPENCIWETRGNQAFNRSVFSNNLSGCTGVAFEGCSGKWRAYINKGGKRQYLGRFEIRDGAICARQQAEEILCAVS